MPNVITSGFITLASQSNASKSEFNLAKIFRKASISGNLNMNKVRVGVIGIGHLGIIHARIYRQLPNAELVAISEINPRRLKEASRKLGVPGYINYKELFGQIEAASIVVPTIDFEILDDNIAYIRLSTFGDSTGKDLKSALKELLKEEPDGLILDLLYKGGGYLDTAIQVVSEFIDDGVVMYEEFSNNERKTYNARRGGVATEIPLVVLINEGSASASEIVAGAIQDRDRGKLVGTTSFGKGSVQVYTPLRNEQGAVRITIARWLTPDGHQIKSIGLEPDFEIEITEEDVKNGVDSQLEKAIELLRQK